MCVSVCVRAVGSLRTGPASLCPGGATGIGPGLPRLGCLHTPEGHCAHPRGGVQFGAESRGGFLAEVGHEEAGTSYPRAVPQEETSFLVQRRPQPCCEVKPHPEPREVGSCLPPEVAPPIRSKVRMGPWSLAAISHPRSTSRPLIPYPKGSP